MFSFFHEIGLLLFLSQMKWLSGCHLGFYKLLSL